MSFKEIEKVDPIKKVETFALEKEVNELRAKVAMLEAELKVHENVKGVKQPEMEIIKTEFKRLYHSCVTQGVSLDKEDLKKLDVLVKAYVSLQNGETKGKKVKKSKKEEDVYDIMKRVVAG
jgi:DNA gyrase/topoisomerase IV subunit A